MNHRVSNTGLTKITNTLCVYGTVIILTLLVVFSFDGININLHQNANATASSSAGNNMSSLFSTNNEGTNNNNGDQQQPILHTPLTNTSSSPAKASENLMMAS